ncbi:MAG: peptide deformylase [Gammaproteobacteria bacterium]|nr:peptide deformylase [Gammaproteobacteria bacterium]
MAIREILRMGHPLLKAVAKPVTQFNTPELQSLITDMRDTMVANFGAGLAAPQIGVGLRVVIFAIQHNPRYPKVEAIPETILINPEILLEEHTQIAGWEGCLSVPGLRGWVPRYQQIRYRAYNLQGDSIDRVVTDFHARVVQHEVDHLDGILYPQRITDMRQFGFEQALFPQQEGLSV